MNVSEIILNKLNILYAFIDKQNIIHITDKRILHFLKIIPKQTHYPVSELFPEIIGQENVLDALCQTKIDKFIIKKINRHLPESIYYDLCLFAVDSDVAMLKNLSYPILLVLTDISHEALQSQRVQQKRNDVHLLQEKLILQNQELKMVCADLEKARQAANSANSYKSLFLANMSHEIRTPLAGIISLIDLLLTTELNEEQLDYLSMAKHSATMLLDIINDILDLSKIESGNLKLNYQNLNISELVKNTTQIFRVQAQNKGIDLIVETNNLKQNFFWTDPLRIRQIIINLIGNALKFTMRGKITLTLKSCPDQTDDPDNIHRVSLSVADTGLGIPPEKKNSIFDLFAQVDEHHRIESKGTGLGLTITKQLIELMQGSISVESKVDEGSTFTVLLPLQIGTTTEISSQFQPEHDKQILDKLKNKKILLVEDNKVNQKIVLRMLERIGLNVDTAADGFEAFLAAKQKKYDLILMDIQLPNMDGITVTKKIRQELHQNVPIIALTALAQDEMRDNFLSSGMNDYLFKPYNYYALQEKLLKFLSL